MLQMKGIPYRYVILETFERVNSRLGENRNNRDSVVCFATKNDMTKLVRKFMCYSCIELQQKKGEKVKIGLDKKMVSV